MSPYVKQTIQDGIATIEFFHPQSNALPSNLLNELAETIEAVGQNPEARVIILRSGGERAFCAGASFDELLTIQDEAAGQAFFSGFAKVINACRKTRQFIIGRVQGKAVGGGVGLAAATDYCLATEHAAIRLSELAVGIGPFVIGPAVERKIGRAAFMELSIDAKNGRPAQWAREKGLYAEVFATPEAMDDAIALLAKQLAEASAEATQALKSVFWQGTEHWDGLLAERAGISGSLVLTETTQAFLKQVR